MAAAAYLRVSTRAQDHEPQRLALARFAEAHGLGELREYVDTASGKTAERPALEELLAACRRGEVGAVVVPRLDRLGRSVRDVCNIAHELEQLDVSLVIADQGLDTRTPAGMLLFHVLAAVAQMERSLLVDRVRSGLEVARAKGKRLGRQPVCPEAVTRARELIAAGSTVKAAAKACGLGYSTLRRALRADAA